MFNVTGGTPGGSYQVVSSTNVGLPAASWPVLTSGNFDGAGNASISNPISAGVPEQFYRVKSQQGNVGSATSRLGEQMFYGVGGRLGTSLALSFPLSLVCSAQAAR